MRKAARAKAKGRYEGYLRSAEWQALRNKALKLAGNKCQTCGATTELNVHHRVYGSTFGFEDIDNLIVLCRECHKAVHRQRRTHELPKHPTKGQKAAYHLEMVKRPVPKKWEVCDPLLYKREDIDTASLLKEFKEAGNQVKRLRGFYKGISTPPTVRCKRTVGGFKLG